MPQEPSRKLPLERKIVDRHHGRRVDGASVVQISRHKPRLPIMRVHNVRPISRDQSLCKQHRYTRQRGEAEWIVTPVRTVGAAIWIAFARKEMGASIDEQVKPFRLRCHDACRATEHIVQRGNHHAAFECTPERTDNPGITERTATPCAASAPGSAPVTSARPPVLISGNISEDHREDVERRHHLKRSSIG